MVPDEMIDECERLRRRLAEQFSQMNQTHDRFAVGEALRHLSDARLLLSTGRSGLRTSPTNAVVDWLDAAH